MKGHFVLVLGALMSLAATDVAQAAYIAPLGNNTWHLDTSIDSLGYTTYSKSLSNFDALTKNHQIGTLVHPTHLNGAGTIDADLFGTNAHIRNGSTGAFSAPWLSNPAPGGHDLSNYLAVQANGYATFSLSAPAHYFGFLWGSVDPFNTVSFFGKAGQLLASFTGADMPSDTGAAGPGGTYYANFTSSWGIWKVELTSTHNAFEIDDVRVSPVPVPAALPLFGAVLAGLGIFAHRRRRKAS